MGGRPQPFRRDLPISGLAALTALAIVFAMAVPGPGAAPGPTPVADTELEESVASPLSTAVGADLAPVLPVRRISERLPERSVRSLWTELEADQRRLRNAAVVRGRCTDPLSGEALAGLEVRLLGVPNPGLIADGAPTARDLEPRRTDDRGEFLFVVDGPEPDLAFELRMRGPGIVAHGSRLGRLLPGEQYVDLESPLQRSVDRRLQVLDRAGQPVVGARVLGKQPVEPLYGIRGQSLEGLAIEGQTDGVGQVLFEAVHPSTRVLSVQDPSGLEGYRLLSDSSRSDAIVVERSRRSIRGRVLHADDRPAAGARVRVAGEGDQQTDCDGEGLFTLWSFDPPSPEPVSLVVLPPSHGAPVPVGEFSFGTANLTIRLPKPGSARVLVETPPGLSPDSVSVIARRLDSTEDWFRLDRLEPSTDGVAAFDLAPDESGLEVCAIAEHGDRRWSARGEIAADTPRTRLALCSSMPHPLLCLDAGGSPVPGLWVEVLSETDRPDLEWHRCRRGQTDEGGRLVLDLPADRRGLALRVLAPEGPRVTELDPSATAEAPQLLRVLGSALQPVEVLLASELDPSATALRVLVRRVREPRSETWDREVPITAAGAVEPISLSPNQSYEFGLGWLGPQGQLIVCDDVLATIPGASSRPLRLDARGLRPAELELLLPESPERSIYRVTDRPTGIRRVVDGTGVGPVLEPTRRDARSWSFSGLSPGRYRPALHWPVDADIQLRSGESLRIHAEVQSAATDLRLRDAQGRPLRSATATIRCSGPIPYLAVTTTDTEGRLRLWPRIEGYALITAETASGRFEATARLPEGGGELELILSAGH